MFEPNKDSDFAADGRNRQLEVVLATPLIRTVTDEVDVVGCNIVGDFIN